MRKLLAEPQRAERRAELGFGRGWLVLIGATELAGAAGIGVRRTRVAALIGLWPCAMGGQALPIGQAHTWERWGPSAIVALFIPGAVGLGPMV